VQFDKIDRDKNGYVSAREYDLEYPDDVRVAVCVAVCVAVRVTVRAAMRVAARVAVRVAVRVACAEIRH